jgi:YggT family protein
MFVIANFLIALATVINIALGAYIWLIIGRVIISWVNADPYNPIVRFLFAATEPVLAPIRRRLPYLGGLDLSPMLLILAIIFLQQFLVPTLQRMAMSLG